MHIGFKDVDGVLLAEEGSSEGFLNTAMNLRVS
jgi:hypothetical protein